jgi:hypothetical protein
LKCSFEYRYIDQNKERETLKFSRNDRSKYGSLTFDVAYVPISVKFFIFVYPTSGARSLPWCKQNLARNTCVVYPAGGLARVAVI